MVAALPAGSAAQQAEEKPSKHPSAVRSPAVRRYVAGVVALGIALSALDLLAFPSPSGVHEWTIGLPALLLGFLVVELAVLTVEVRKGTVGLPLTEVPLVAALLLFSFPVAVLASCLAVAGRAMWRRQHWVVASYNLGSAAAEVATAFLVADGLIAVGVPELVAVFSGLVVSSLVSSVNVLCLAVAMDGTGAVRAWTKLATTTLTMAVVGPLLVVLGAQLLRSGSTGWALLTAVATAFALLYRAYSVLLHERRDVDLVQAISGTVVGDGDVWPRVAELVRQQFNASRAVVRAPDSWVLSVAGDPLDEHQEAVVSRPDALTAEAVDSAQLLRMTSCEPASAEALRARGVSEALVAPLGSGHGAGSIELHDRQNQLRGFGSRDVQLLDTLAKHVATAVDNRRLLAEMRDAAYHDRLTGLTNRLGFIERAAHVLAERVEVTPPQFTVLHIGVGALGQVNDALGHGWGERLVALAADRVTASVVDAAGQPALISRVEGDTFAVLLLDATVEHCEQVAAELAVVLGAPYPIDGLAVEASPAIGVAVLDLDSPQPWPDVEQLMQRADVAMQAARAAGEPVRTYHASMGQVFLRRFQLVTQFRGALEAGQILVHYQPKLSLSGRTVVGAEALMRWTHPEFGVVDPEELVRVLEATGLMDHLTRFVLDDALLRCRRLLDRGLRIDPAVNVSVRNLLSPAFPAMVADALERHGVPAQMLTLEITETSVMGDAERTLPALRVLHEMGVLLSVDDFGTGYSSLSYLRRLPVDEVKIDKSFVLGMGTDLGDLAVVRAIIDLGRSLGLRVVAEGVETDVVRDQLAEMGCDVVQGYLIARAMHPDRFDTWLHARTVTVAEGAAQEVAAPRLAG